MKCSEFGFEFHRNYSPTEYIEGFANSPIWIIGLNPAFEKGYKDTRSGKDLESHLSKAKNYQYFKDFGLLLPELHDKMGVPKGVATTEIVKCFSKKFPSGKCGSTLIQNCQSYLKQQIIEHKPKLIICSSSGVSRYVERTFPSSTAGDTAYIHGSEDFQVGIVLGGYVKYMDVYSRRRLKTDIETMMSELCIWSDERSDNLAA